MGCETEALISHMPGIGGANHFERVVLWETRFGLFRSRRILLQEILAPMHLQYLPSQLVNIYKQATATDVIWELVAKILTRPVAGNARRASIITDPALYTTKSVIVAAR